MQGLTRSTVLSLVVVVMGDGEICLSAPLIDVDVHCCFVLLIRGVRDGGKVV